MKRFFLGLIFVGLMMVAVSAMAQENKVELEEIIVPSTLEIKADLVDVYDGIEAVGEETIRVVNRETLYSNSTPIMVWATLKFIYPDGEVKLIKEIHFEITRYGDIAISLERGDFNKDEVTDILLTYQSGDKELIFWKPKYQSIEVVPYEEPCNTQ